MRRIIFIILIMIVLSGVCTAKENGALQNRNGKLSYSVGYQIGSDFLRQGIAIKPEILLKGIQDAQAEKEPFMRRQEMRETLKNLRLEVAEAQQQKMLAKAEKNLEDGKAFLSKNTGEDGIITLANGLQYRVITAGSGKSPKEKDTVTVHYRGTLVDGTEFDSSYSRGEPATFRTDMVIDGWKEALQLMQEGSKWQLFIPPELAYGDKRTGLIEPNSTLVFEVELVSVRHPGE